MFATMISFDRIRSNEALMRVRSDLKDKTPPYHYSRDKWDETATLLVAQILN